MLRVFYRRMEFLTVSNATEGRIRVLVPFDLIEARVLSAFMGVRKDKLVSSRVGASGRALCPALFFAKNENEAVICR